MFAFDFDLFWLWVFCVLVLASFHVKPKTAANLQVFVCFFLFLSIFLLLPRTFFCPPRYIAVVVLDMLLAILLIGYAVVAFFFVKSGRYAVEVAENSSVDYFGEAERYFPSGGSEENEGLAK